MTTLEINNYLCIKLKWASFLAKLFEHNPGRYVGLPDNEDDFAKRFIAVKTQLEEQPKEEVQLNEIISQNKSRKSWS